jgi:hypothetical protein
MDTPSKFSSFVANNASESGEEADEHAFLRFVLARVGVTASGEYIDTLQKEFAEVRAGTAPDPIECGRALNAFRRRLDPSGLDTIFESLRVIASEYRRGVPDMIERMKSYHSALRDPKDRMEASEEFITFLNVFSEILENDAKGDTLGNVKTHVGVIFEALHALHLFKETLAKAHLKGGLTALA